MKKSMSRDFALGIAQRELKRNPKCKNIHYTKHVSTSKLWYANVKFKGMNIPDELPLKMYRERGKSEIKMLEEK